jgi:hypothetical protein
MTPRPSLPVRVAHLWDRIVDIAQKPIAGPEVMFEPVGMRVHTDADGQMEAVVPVGVPGCAWIAIEVRARRYGTYTRFDERLTQSRYSRKSST